MPEHDAWHCAAIRHSSSSAPPCVAPTRSKSFPQRFRQGTTFHPELAKGSRAEIVAKSALAPDSPFISAPSPHLRTAGLP